MKPADIVLVRFPFADLETAKKRPALVLSVTSISPSASLLSIAMITSKLDGLSLSGDVRLKGWEAARLLHPSVVRLSKIATIDSELIERRIGALHEPDVREIKRAFRKIFEHWAT